MIILVKAGPAVDAFIDQLTPHLEKGDIIIDGGNSHYPDSIRRTKALEEKGEFGVADELMLQMLTSPPCLIGRTPLRWRWCLWW